jgi:hypothetical protein
MQNGLRCTYVVARYAPSGNEGDGFSKNVKIGKFDEKKHCRDVMNRLVTFEARNKAKVQMVGREKQMARLEFLEKLKVF